MAKIPPKAPIITPNWSDFSHQKLPPMEYYMATNTTTTTTGGHNQSWVDEFLNFSSAKRGNHRRSASDSVAFLEMSLEEESCRRSSTIPGSGNTSSDFDRLDDEQLLSMFTDDIPAPTLSCSNPSSPSDHNSFNEEKMKQQLKNEAADQEVQSSCDNEGQVAQPTTNYDNSNEKIFDPKRIKRILANRQSAQRSRVRKLHYISELERSVTSLQAEVSVLSPRVAFFDHQRMVLTVDNGVLKQRIAALAQDKIFKDAHQEALKREIERLRQIYYQQNAKKMENDSPPQSKLQPSAMDTNGPGEKEQLVT